jgi:GGDEF domain-containing protein
MLGAQAMISIASTRHMTAWNVAAPAQLEDANLVAAALSITDSLAGLANRAPASTVLRSECADRAGQPLTVIDVDYFKIQ